MLEKLRLILTKIKKDKPLVLNLTNYVTMDLMANALLALGAAPIMTVEKRELADLVTIAHAINLNIGTLNADFIERAHFAADLAQKQNKPIILDPVGAGASKIRTDTAIALLSKSTTVKGNASEIMALYSDKIQTLGVEAIHSSTEAHEMAQQIAIRNKDLIIVVSGEIDNVFNASTQKSLQVGSPIMKLVTGMGCTLAAIIAAFQAVWHDRFEASVLATAYFGLCGQQAEKFSALPGSFREQFINALYAPNIQMMTEDWAKHHDAI